jgi:hypothetical protein
MRSLRNSFFVKGRFALISGFVVTAFLLGIVITRSTHAQGNEPPEADAGGPYSGSPQQSISLSGSGSWDPDGWITNYSWNFGDGTTAVIDTPLVADRTSEYHFPLPFRPQARAKEVLSQNQPRAAPSSCRWSVAFESGSGEVIWSASLDVATSQTWLPDGN